ncbi:MAG: DUF362 domain-containing protein [Alphaproteobacteria bacterium]|nr:DUF362 domain-containing protein [Alphaproteobacteria bacterium]
MTPLTRRSLLAGSAALAAATTGLAGYKILGQPKTRVATLRAGSYDGPLSDLLLQGIRSFPDTVARAKGARVVLKPNLVEYNPGRPINTHPRIIGAAVEAFRQLGAAEVVVAEGPGHRRDTELILELCGLAEVLRDLRVPFVDLNVDRTRTVALPLDATGMGKLELAATAAGADLLVSVAKLKTHHWAGATLSMKNLFGVVPGAVYGWPKNPLHWAGIPASILDLWSALKPGFAIIDGITGMEGDGPIMGDPVEMGCVVVGEQCPAVDATAARLMGIRAENLAYLDQASWSGGTVAASRIEVFGDVIQPRTFRVIERQAHILAG